LTATNSAGFVTASLTVTVTGSVVAPAPPTIDSFTANPPTIQAGQSSTLSWSVSNATSLNIDNGVGTVASSGSRSVSPAASTTYTLTATNSAGSVTASLTVTVTGSVVTPAPPTIASFTANPPTIQAGQSSTLSWSVSDATSLNIDNGVGTVTSSGSRSVSPAASTTYTLTATNSAGSVTASLTVTVTGSVGTPASFYAAAVSTCANMPLRSTGTIYYFCDCQSGAQSGCVAGADTNNGTSPSTPKQTLSALVTTFNAMAAGDTAALCKGGSWTTNAAVAFGANANCSGSGSLRAAANTTTCDLRDYAPSWGGTAKPIITETRTATNLLQFWNGPASGVRVLNLDVEGRGTGPGGTDVGTSGITTAVGQSNYLFCNNTVNGWTNGFQINANANLSGPTNMDLWGNTVTNCSSEGILAASSTLTIDSNLLDNIAHDASTHYIYADNSSTSTATNTSIINNTVQRTGTTACSSVMVVFHGAYDFINIENNVVDGGANGNGCWGIDLDDGGYPIACFFRHLTIRRNLVKNVGFRAIAVAEAVGAIIENNIVVSGSTTANSAAITVPRVAHRTGTIIDDTMTAATIRNNTMYYTSGAVSPIGFASALEGTNYVVANNTIAFAGSGGTCLSMGLSVASYAYDNHNLCNGFQNWELTRGTLAAWQTYSGGFDAASLTSAPQFENPPTGFVPAAGSPLLGNGDTAQAPAYDFALRLRPNPVSVGALER
jgi:hypothetical protein